MGRIVSVLMGYDDLPGATITRYCSSSVQTSRMAFHAIKAGEGDVFISAGVETVSRFAKGTSDSLPGHPEPGVRRRRGPHRQDRRGRRRLARPARGRRRPRRLHRDGPDRRERREAARAVAREELDEFGVRSQNLAEKAIDDGFWANEITPVTTPDGTVVSTDDGPRAGVTLEAVSDLKPVFRPDGVVTAGELLPAQRRRRRGRGHVRHQGQGARPDPAGPDRLHRRHRPLPRDHGPRPGRGDQAGAGPGEHDDRRHRPRRDQRGVRRAGGAVVPGPRHRPRPAERQRRRDRGRATRSA